MHDPKPLRVLIADDEPLAAERLQLLLARAEGAQLVGTSSDGESAINLAQALNPDVLLLDIAMPGLDGIGVARALAALTPSPAVVFVTAFDQFAVAAFEVEAVDYLMKPVDPARLQRALDRARAYLHQRSVAPSADRASRWLEEFWASDLSGLVRIAARDVDRVSAERDYMRLHVGRRSWLIHHSMAALEEGPGSGVVRSAPPLSDRAQGLHRRLHPQSVGPLDRQLGDGTEQPVGRLYSDTGPLHRWPIKNRRGSDLETAAVRHALTERRHYRAVTLIAVLARTVTLPRRAAATAAS
jgi:two-component system response regulator AlgR